MVHGGLVNVQCVVEDVQQCVELLGILCVKVMHGMQQWMVGVELCVGQQEKMGVKLEDELGGVKQHGV